MVSWAGFTKKRWDEINRRINECKRLSSYSERLNCLLQLYDQTKDGMVALEIGEESYSEGQLEQAVKYYEKAERRFPFGRMEEQGENKKS